MKYIPQVYQDHIIDFELDRPRCNVWAGMGMGKTSSTLTSLSHLSLTTSYPTLILGPLRVANSTWPNEVAKWDHLSHFRCVPIAAPEGDRPATAAERIKRLKLDADLFTINYDNLPWLVDYFKSADIEWPFRTVVADESTRLKGFRLQQGTKRAKAIGPLAHTKIDRWINLTGTPAPNGLTDLWGQNWFVDAGERLGRSYSGFQERWFQYTRQKVKLTGGKTFMQPVLRPLHCAQDEIQQRMRDVAISVLAKDYFDLKDPIARRVEIELPRKVRGLYRDMEKHMFMEIRSKEFEAVHAAHRSMRCLQLAAGFALNDDGTFEEVHDLKLQALESIVHEAAGMPVLVAYQWVPDLVRLKRAFPKGRRLDANPKTEDEWNRGEIPIMFAHPKSAGHGLNLQYGSNILCRYSDWWDFELHDQVAERIGPMRQMQAGLERPVFHYSIIALDTVDETVELRHKSKRGVQDLLLDAASAKGY